MCEHLNVNMSPSSVRACIQKAGFTHKKCRYVVCKNGLDDKRAEFAALVTSSIDPSDVISIDESSVMYESPPLKGYTPRGTRLECKTKNYHTKKWSVLLAVSNTEVVDVIMVDGSINSDVFAMFVSRLGVHGKKHLLMDNASIHKTKTVKAAIAATGMSPLFLPPYTPWFQPVEHCFSVLKNDETHHESREPCTTSDWGGSI